MVEDDALAFVEVFHKSADTASSKQMPAPDAFKEFEPWLFQEFGDIVELVDE